MKMILGKKVGMISSFLTNGKMIPVTVIHSEPNIVIEVKNKEKNGYIATKIGYESIEEKKLLKPQALMFKKLKVPFMKHIKELKDVSGYNIGEKINVSIFSVGDHVDVQSKSKGKGFTGAIKRWNFKCGPKSHGAGYPHRYQGSISFGRGGSQGQRVMKGKKMSGHHGNFKKTIQNLEVVGVDLEKNLIMIKGSIPGPNNAIVFIKETKKTIKHSNPLEIVNFKKIEGINNNLIQGDTNG